MKVSYPVTLISHPRFKEHDTGGRGHPENPARLTAIENRLDRSDIAPVLDRIEVSREAEWHWLAACHEEAYLYRFEETALSGRSYIDHPDNQLSAATYEAALLAVGCGITGIDLIENGQAVHVFCLVRPPGHHAERGMALGFCFLNNVAIAARYWQQACGRRRIMIIDWDAHHGNGIQAAFEEDPEVYYISLHEHPTFSFPGTGWAEDIGTGRGLGTTLNIPLTPGTGDDEVLKALDEKVEPAMAAFGPDALLVAAGFDGSREDDMSGLAYSTFLYGHLGRITADWSRRFCQGRVVSMLEGGYHLQSLAAGVEAYLQGLTTGGR